MVGYVKRDEHEKLKQEVARLKTQLDEYRKYVANQNKALLGIWELSKDDPQLKSIHEIASAWIPDDAR